MASIRLRYFISVAYCVSLTLARSLSKIGSDRAVSPLQDKRLHALMALEEPLSSEMHPKELPQAWAVRIRD